MPYSGLFLRDYLGQTPTGTNTGQGWTSSPDIIPYGQNPATDTSIFTSPDGYANPFSSEVFVGQNNWLYVRALNATSGPVAGRFWLYYTSGNAVLWPQNWERGGIEVRGIGQNWVDAQAQTPNEVVVGAAPFLWKPPAESKHYCLIAFAENPPLSSPPESPAPTGYMNTWDQLGQYVISHPNMAWRNTVDVKRDTPTWQYQVPITGADEGGMFYCGIKMTTMPTDAFFSFSVLGPDNRTTGPNQDSIIIPRTQIVDPNQSFTIPITWPQNYATTMQISFWKGATTPAFGSTIEAQVVVPVNRSIKTMPSLAEAMERSYSRAERRIRADEWPAGLRRPQPVMAYESGAMLQGSKIYAHVIGSVPFRNT
jgi:hypothetical protein